MTPPAAGSWAHNATGELDVESSIQYGVGGAGAFSDGKLQTGTKSRPPRILETFVEAGAQPGPVGRKAPRGKRHLPRVVTNIVRTHDRGGRRRCGAAAV